MRRKELSGSVTAVGGAAVGGLLIEAWSPQGLEAPLASTVVTDDGIFTLAFDESQREQRLSFRFFAGTELVAAMDHDLDGDVATFELPTAPPDVPRGPIYAVRGRVRGADGAPIAGARVIAYDRNLRHETLLGASTTDGHGRYEIRYPVRLLDAGKIAADLIVRAYSGNDVAGSSPVAFRAPNTARLDIDLGPGVRPGMSTYSQMVGVLAPLLDAAPLEELADTDITFLAGKTEFPEDHLRDLARAHRLSAQSGIGAETWYGLLRHGLPADLNGLLSVPAKDVEVALARAMREGLIPAGLESDVSAIHSRLGRLRTNHPLRKPETDTEITFGALLAAGGVPRLVQETFVRLVALHVGPAANLWRKVEIHPDGGKQAVTDLSFTLQASALARGSMSLLHHLVLSHRRGELKTLRDLAGMEHAEWRTWLDRASVHPPADAPGEEEDNRKDALARWLAGAIDAGFPTAALARRLARENDTKTSGVKFLVDHPDVELARDRPRDVSNNPAITADLERLQRLYRLSPKHRHVRALQRAGFDSAVSIAGAGHAAFARAVGDSLTAAEVDRLYAAASRVALGSMGLLVEHGAELQVAAIPDTAGEAVPELAAIVNTNAFSSCPECASVIGQAAYLSDVLGLLRDVRASGKRSALDVLFDDRRGDLGALELGCSNTNTRLPRIDLVIELLEHAVSRETHVLRSTERAAAMLAAATYPLNLPFDLARVRARVYLEHLGLSRTELMNTFQRRDHGAPTDAEIAAEELDLLPGETDVITGGYRQAPSARLATRAPIMLRGLPVVDGTTVAAGDRILVKHQENTDDDGLYQAGAKAWTRLAASYGPGLIVEVEDGPSRGAWVQTAEGWERLKASGERDALPRQPWEHWGFPDDGSITDATWPSQIADVEVLLKRSGLDKATLVEILDTSWVNPGDKGAYLDDDGLRVRNLTGGVARRLLRFTRLLRRVGFSVRELDRLIRAVAGREVTDRFIAKAAQVKKLSAETQLPLATLVTLYVDLSVTEYNRLFGEAGESLQLVEATGEPKAEGKPISGVAAALLPALGITADDLAILINDEAAEKLGLSAAIPDELSVSTLSRIQRRIVLARAAGISLRELVVLSALSRIAPFDDDRIDETRRFVALARKLRGLGIAIADLDDLLRGSPKEAQPEGAALRAAARGKTDDEIVELLAPVLRVTPAVARILAGDAIHAPQRALDALREGEEDAARVMRKLRRAARLVTFLRLEPELSWLTSRGPELGLLDPDDLPEERASTDEAAARFLAWEKLVAYADLRETLPARSPSLAELLEATLDIAPDTTDARKTAFFAAVASRTGWAIAEIETVAAGLGLSFPKDFRDVRSLARLVECFGLAHRAGASATRLLGWREGPLTLADAADMAAAVRERSGPAKLEAIDASVRARRRDALVGYLLHARGLPDAAALSGLLLVDVLTGEGASSSRIELAIGSVQRFIQRCLLGLEPEIAMSGDDTRRWRWLHDFAAWQTRRRAILQPENRLLDELPERSPFFHELERELSLDRPDDALRHYLERLDEVARLEIAGLHEVDGELHLVGRTAGVPRRHYYRKRAGSEWGPWEPVAADIQADVVLPIAWNGRVALLWPVVQDGSVHLAWSERQRAGFTAGRTSTDRVPAGAAKLAFRTRATDIGEPLVLVLEHRPPSARRSAGPRLGAPHTQRARVLGAFRWSNRGPVLADAPSATETITEPLPAPGQLRIARNDSLDMQVLKKTGPSSRLVTPHRADTQTPLAFDDGERSYLVTLLAADEVPWGDSLRWMPGTVDVAARLPWDGDGGGTPGRLADAAERLFPRPELGRYRFEPLYHPFTGELLGRLAREGIDGLFSQLGEHEGFSFASLYDPVPGTVDDDQPVEKLAFAGGPYAQYNWELFFHAPLLVATRLAAAGRHDEAQRWFHRVFDPTDPEKRFWKVPLQVEGNVEGWLRAPFDPHSIARARSGEYQRAVVMKYLENLVAWGDKLLEKKATGAAEMLFRLASDVLGPAPKLPPEKAGISPTFNKLAESSTNVLVAVENFLPGEANARPVKPGDGIEAVIALGRNLSGFCVPPNEALLRYWGMVADRLNKVR